MIPTVTLTRTLTSTGNMLTIVEGLSKLSALTELNLRRNSISTISELDTLPALQVLTEPEP